MLNAAAHWFQTTEPAYLSGLAGASVLVSAIVLALAWLILRGVAAIVGEYFKRAWFSEWRDELKNTKAQLLALRADVAAERAQHAAERRMLEQLIRENDRLLQQNIHLLARRCACEPDWDKAA